MLRKSLISNVIFKMQNYKFFCKPQLLLLDSAKSQTLQIHDYHFWLTNSPPGKLHQLTPLPWLEGVLMSVRGRWLLSISQYHKLKMLTLLASFSFVYWVTKLNLLFLFLLAVGLQPGVAFLQRSTSQSREAICLPGPHFVGVQNPLQYSCLENPMDWGAW